MPLLNERKTLVVATAMTLFVPAAATAQSSQTSGKRRPSSDVSSETQSGESPTTQRTTTQELSRLAKQAEEAGDYYAANDLLLEAWQGERSAEIASSLGHAELRLGKCRAAAEHLAFAIRHASRDADPDRIYLDQRRLQTCKETIVTLKLDVKPETAHVSVNGRPLGAARELPPEVFEVQGEIEVVAMLEGQEPARSTLTANRGETKTVRLRVGSPRTATETTRAPATAPMTRHDDAGGADEERNWVPVYVSGGLAVTAAIFGTALAIDAHAAKNEGEEALRSAETRFGSSPCASGAGAGSEACDRLLDVQSRRDRSSTASTIAFAASGVFAAAAIGSYFLWPKEEGTPDTVGHVSGWMGPTGGGLTLDGRF